MVNTLPSTKTRHSLPAFNSSNNGQSSSSVDRDSTHDVSNFQTIAARIRQLRDIISEMDEDRSFFLHALDRSLQEYSTVDSATVNPQAITNPQIQPPQRQQPQRQPQQRQESLASLASLQRAEQQFRQAVASIGGGETPAPARHQQERPARSPPSESMSDHRQSKRRKVDADDNREGAKGFSYSHYGQVSSVPLEMEVHSCKGASSEPDRRGNSPEHLLVNDGAIYRAQGGGCNIVLKHRGEIPFSLKKLIIKTPKSGCHDEMNVREGSVSISMVSDPRFLRTVASHASQSLIPSSRRSHRRNDPSGLFVSAMAPPASSRRVEAMRARTRLLRSRANPQPDLQIGTEQEDKSDDESTQHDAARDQLSISDLEPSNSSGSSPNIDTSDSESSDGIAGVAEALAHNLDSRQRELLEALGVHVPSRSSRNRALSPTTVFARPAAESRTRETDTMLPIARFSIEHERAAVQIRFNPPVSARYILIKMWAPFNPGRMDIESIIAHGFAGPRFFPSQEPR
ncbi:hypothetical protein FQN49_005858 [Arthroderma sp. PD_2]|nr:hypothetical protein FQN49_005858 [Arthroderma sp. PD_2]